jgi:hypothetical protein
VASRSEQRAVGDTSRRTTTSTTRPAQRPSAESSNPVPALILAALLFLALLVPTTGYHTHTHGRWHR